MKEKKRTMDEIRQVKTYGYKEPMIHERNPDSGEIRSRPIGSIDSAVDGWSDKIENIINKIDSISNKLDKIDDAIDKLLK